MSKLKKVKPGKDESSAKLAAFNLPEDLSESSISLGCRSQILSSTKSADWNELFDAEVAKVIAFEESKKPPKIESIFLDTETEYIEKEILPFLVPALEETLRKAKQWNSLESQRLFFNGLDFLAEQLWNRSPTREQGVAYMPLFNMPWVREALEKKPRPKYPQSYLWPQEYAATIIQRNVRKFLVQKRPDVCEMRNFWKKLQFEEANPTIMSNPMFAKTFARDWDFTVPKPNIAFKQSDGNMNPDRKSFSVKSVLNLYEREDQV